MYKLSLQETKNIELLRLARCDEFKKRAKKRNKADAVKYMSSEHEFTMFHDNVKTPIKIKMKGRDAKLKNRLNVLDFGAGKTKTLIRWVAIDTLNERVKNGEDTGYGVGTNPSSANQKNKSSVFK